jgi:UDP-glucose 4-epimerase
LSGAIILFGASGFIGRNLVDRLSRDGHDIYAVNASGKPVLGARQTVALKDVDQLPDLPATTNVIHVGAYRYESNRFELKQSDILVENLALNARVFKFCAERKLKELRMASSVAVYPSDLAVMDDGVSVDLNRPPHAGEAFYAWSKRTAEVMAALYHAQFGLNTICFRLSNPYGPYDSVDPGKAHVAPAFVMKALDNTPVFQIMGDPLVERDFVFVGDVVEAFAKSLALAGQNEAYNLCTGSTNTLLELAETVMRVAGVSKPIESGAPGAFGPKKRVSTNERIQKALDLQFCDLETGMASTIAWYRENFHV